MKEYNKRAWVEINLDKLEQNVRKLRHNLFESTELMPIVKANAYGHGDIKICAKLSEIGIKYYGVASISEAVTVRQTIHSGDILIMGYTPPEYAKDIFKYDIIQSIVSFEHAVLLDKMAVKPIRCHIKIDTGMGRVGLKNANYYECANEIEKIIKLRKISVEGIFTHYAVADSDTENDIAYTNAQTEYILAVHGELKRRNIDIRHVHFLNSAGFSYHNHPQSTLARVGINLYGLSSNYERGVPFGLEPLLEFKTIISQVKYINKGDSVSYGRTFTAEKEMKIASLTVGYADGYSRLLSSKGEALVHGIRCKIIGRVCMDQIMLDVSDVPNVSAGDTVTLIGREGNEIISADYLASLYGTIDYEVVCGISNRVSRVYLQ